MKKLTYLYLAIALLSTSFSAFAERVIFNPPIPKPCISVEKAIELVRAEIKKGEGQFRKTDAMILQSVEYYSYEDIIKKYKSYSVETKINKISKEGNWEWVIKFFNTKMSDDYYIYMVTQNGDVLLLELCCI